MSDVCSPIISTVATSGTERHGYKLILARVDEI
jgi:hypothetical protein